MAARKVATKTRKGKKRPAKKGASRGLAVLALFSVLLFGALALPLFLVTSAGLIPTIAAIVIDRYPGKYLTRTVGAMNLAGLAPMVVRLWSTGDNLSAAIGILSRPTNWLIMYGAAAVGWCIFLAMPAVARIIVDLQAEQIQSQLRDRAARLVEEWGEEVKGRADDAPLVAPKAKAQ